MLLAGSAPVSEGKSHVFFAEGADSTADVKKIAPVKKLVAMQTSFRF